MAADLAKARWVEARLRELPKYVMFFYNLLLDQKLTDEHREQAFGTLSYIVEQGDIIPKDDVMLDGIDELSFAFRCMSDLVGRLPPATFGIYEEALLMDGIKIREILPDVPRNLGRFYDALGALFRDRVNKRAKYYKSCVKTGEIVRFIRSFLASKPTPWTPERYQAVETFLESFALGPAPAAPPPVAVAPMPALVGAKK